LAYSAYRVSSDSRSPTRSIRLASAALISLICSMISASVGRWNAEPSAPPAVVPSVSNRGGASEAGAAVVATASVLEGEAAWM
jgi:hypothetical protein